MNSSSYLIGQPDRPDLCTRLMDPTHGPDSWTLLVDPTCGALKMRSCSELDSLIGLIDCPCVSGCSTHGPSPCGALNKSCSGLDSWTETWSLKNNELFQIGLVDQLMEP